MCRRLFISRISGSEDLLLRLASFRLLGLGRCGLGLSLLGSLLLLLGGHSSGSLILLLVSRKHLLLLLSLPVLPPLTCFLDLGPTGVSLVSQHLGPGLLCLLLEGVSLCLQVQLVVQVAVNLLGLPVSLKQPPEDAHSHDPHGLLGGSGILGTLPLSKASVPAFPARLVVLAHARPGVDSDRLLDHKTILDELADVLARVPM